MTFFGPDLRNGLPIGLGSVAGFGIAPQFSPASLFLGGTVQGAWYDPSDSTTLFSDRAGTTPCGTPGGGSVVPVGLMLDKSQGLVLGPDVVTNGNFATDSNWNKGTGWAISGGAAVATATSDPIFQGPSTGTGVGTTVGKFYVATWNQVVTSGSTRFRSNTYSGNYTTTGSQIYYFLADSQNIHIYGNSFTGTIDNLVVRELPGNHAIAANDTTARPELRARVNLLERSEELSNVTVWPDLTGASGGNAPVRTANAGVAPDGTLTADRLQLDAAGATSGFRSGVRQTVAIVSGVAYTRLLYLKAYDAGSVGKTVRVHIDGIGSETIVTLTDSWQTVSNSQTSTSTSAIFIVECRGSITTQTADILVWGADLRPTNIGTAMPAYQRISDANTYDAVGFPRYLFFDGVDDSMSFNNAILGNSAFTGFVGALQRGSLPSRRSFVSIGAGAARDGLDFGYGASAGRYNFTEAGVADLLGSPANYPNSIVQTATYENAGRVYVYRENGVQQATFTDSSNLVMTSPGSLGTRYGTVSQGNIYSVILVGQLCTAGQISATEQWVAGKTGITI